MWWCAPMAPAMAQNVAGPPEVTVDLSVLDSIGHAPPRHREIAPRPTREKSRAAAPPVRRSTHTAAKKPKPPAKKAAVTPPRPVRHAAAPPSRHEADRDVDRDDAERAARDEAIWEADRKREETDRKRTEADRFKREEAARMKQAKAEIEAASRNAAHPAKTSENILEPDAGPTTPPAPATTMPKTAEPPVKAPGQVAAMTPPSVPPPAAAPTPEPATTPVPAHPKPAATEAPIAEAPRASGAPHVDFAVGATDLSAAARAELDALAKQLNADQNGRVQLVAYATGAADEANQARRLSLSRALNVRAYLIDHGVRNTRMDVRALGNRPDGNKPADRVEIVFFK